MDLMHRLQNQSSIGLFMCELEPTNRLLGTCQNIFVAVKRLANKNDFLYMKRTFVYFPLPCMCSNFGFRSAISCKVET